MLKHPSPNCARISAAAFAALLSAAGMTQAQEVDVTLGLGALYAPDYEGSDDYQVQALPLIELSIANRFTFSTFGGPALTAQLYQGNGFQFEAGFGYSFGRKAVDNAALGGLGDIDDSASFLAAATYETAAGQGNLSFGLDAEIELDGNRQGTLVALNADYTMPIFAQRAQLTLSAESTWADDAYMASTFGVTAAQAASSTAGLAAYSAGSGFKDITLSATVAYPVNDNVTLVGELGVSRLMGDAANAPIVASFGARDQGFAKLGVLYSW